MSLTIRPQAHTSRRPSLTPLVDVVFILLVFFMLQTTFLEEGERDVTTDTGGGRSTAALLRVEILDDRYVWLNGGRVATEELADALARLTLVDDTPAMVDAAPHISAQRIIVVLDALSRRGLTRIALNPQADRAE